MYHSLLCLLPPAACAHPHFSSRRSPLYRRKFIKKLPTFLTIGLRVVSVAARQQAPTTALSLPHVCHFYKKETKPFFPQKKVPEPISHLALSPPFGLTTKAHLCIYPCVLCTQNQQIYHLILEVMVLSLLERTHFHTYFESIATSSRSFHYSTCVFFSLYICTCCVCVFLLNIKSVQNAHIHTYSHTPNI